MSQIRWMVGALLITLGSVPTLGWTAEHGGKEHGGAAAAPAAGTQEHGGNVTAQAAPAAAPSTETAPPVTGPVAPPALKPIIITFSGELMSADTAASPGMISVQDRYGVKKEIAVPAETKVTKGTQSASLADLKAEGKVTVEYTYDVATGKRTAQSITIGESDSTTPAAQ